MNIKQQEAKWRKEVWLYWETIFKECVRCCECNKKIEFKPSHVSHLMSKGALPSMRLNVLNVVPMCFNCHQNWEFGNRQKFKNKNLNNQKDFIKRKHYEQ